MNKLIRIGTRSSALALWQTEFVKDLLLKTYPDITVELVHMSTKGDRVLERPLAEIGGKGLFTEELESAMFRGEVDLAVHSLKDMPTELPEGLVLGAITKRENPFDAFVSNTYASLEELPEGAVVGTSSLRRQAQLLALRPDLQIRMLRGNVQTRLRKLDEGEYDAIILAAAGLKRLGLENRIQTLFSLEMMIPAVGQGAVVIECVDTDEMKVFLAPLMDDETAIAVTAERAFLARLQGGCQVPIGAHATVEGDAITMEGFVASLDGKQMVRQVLTGAVSSSEALGVALAERLLAEGGVDIISELIKEGVIK